MIPYICSTCCAEFPPSDHPPQICPICSDPRQYINPNGQSWITNTELAEHHHTDLRQQEPGLLGIGVTPQAGIGQRALLIEHASGGIMWEGVPLLDDAAIDEIQRRGGVRAMVMSHPHLYGAMVTNSQKLGNVPIYLPEADRDWVMRPHENIRYWSGDELDLDDGIKLFRTGGHFEGSSFLHWPQGANGKGALLTGDTIAVAPDPDWVSFMWSTPNMVPLSPRAMRTIVATAEKLSYDRIYAGWWNAVMQSGAKAKVAASEQRILEMMRMD